MTQYYQISGDVPFLDVHVEKDNRLYIDPSAIRRAPGATAGKARRLLDQHFGEVLRCLNSPSPADKRWGERLLQRYHEPNETRLGMSRVGSRGRGAADELGTRLWQELQANPLCRESVAILKYVEDIPVFVDDIGSDITSDLTTRIVFEALADFTQSMVDRYPEFRAHPHHMSEGQYECWDEPSATWQEKSFSLPAVTGKPLLLVPRDWVYFRLIQNHSQYYNVPLLGQVRDERTTYVKKPNGGTKSVRPKKKNLRRERQLAPSRRTNIDRTLEVFERVELNLMESYRQYIDERYAALRTVQLLKYLAK